VSALLLFLPVLGAPILHAPVLALDLFQPLKRPLDGGATWRGRRLFGDNKTWRGAIVMTLGPLLATLALWQWGWWHDTIPAAARDARPALVGLLIGLGIVLGELPNSLLKRQLDVAPGTQAAGSAGALLTTLDQGDLVIGIWLCLLPVYGMPLWLVALAFVIVSAVHLLINVIGYAIGARSAPI
jgi:CDP-diglyceride synthetase